MGDLQKASYLIIFFYHDDREITLIKDQMIKILNLILQWTEKESTEHQASFFLFKTREMGVRRWRTQQSVT